MGCAKYFLFSMNFVVWISSVVVLGTALSVHMGIKEVVNMFSGIELQMIPISAIVAGCALFIISFSGCCGAMKEWKWMLIIYLIFLLVIIGAEAYFIYVVMDFRDRLVPKLEEQVDLAFKNHATNNFHALEKLFKCCGSRGASDYKNEPVPTICCDLPVENTCQKDTYGGCAAVFKGYIEKYSQYADYGMIGVGVLELLALTAALCMICTIGERRKSSRV